LSAVDGSEWIGRVCSLERALVSCADANEQQTTATRQPTPHDRKKRSSEDTFRKLNDLIGKTAGLASFHNFRLMGVIGWHSP
jgi:hypothetical protein